MDILDGYIKASMARPFTPRETDEKRGDCWFCKICGAQRYGWFDLPSGDSVFINTSCSCDRRKSDEVKKAEAARTRRMATGMANSIIEKSRFENDLGYCNFEAVKAAKKYVSEFPENRRSGKGILFWGDVGVGKSFLSYCIANAVDDMEWTLRSCVDAERGQYIETPQHYHIYLKRPDQAFRHLLQGDGEFWHIQEITDLVVISDLGREAPSDRMSEFINSWVDFLYEYGIPCVVTTNLSIDTMMDTDDARAPAFDRLLSRCEVVRVTSNIGVTARQAERRDIMNGGDNERI